LGRPTGSYDTFAQHYDAVIGDRAPVGRYLMALIRRAAPGAKTVLELGCGSGTMLEHLTARYRTTGVDSSRRMLALAKRKAPRAKVLYGDMRSLALGERFDVVVCPFDTMNHLATRRDWSAAFRVARAHLNPGGIFIFDVNTEHKLERYRNEPVELREHDGSYASVSVRRVRRFVYDVTLAIFLPAKRGLFRRDAMTIRERVPQTKEILGQLRPLFPRIGVVDPDRGVPRADSDELFFVCFADAHARPKRF